MSPNVGNFVSDLVEMAKATEQLPLVQAQLDRANTMIEEQAKAIQSRELHIIELKAMIDELSTKLRAMEVSRDDAEYRFLEADEKLGKIAQSFQGALAALDGTGKLIQKETAKPEPEAPNVDTIHSEQAQSGSLILDGQEQSQSGGSIGETTAAPSPAHASDGTVSPEPYQAPPVSWAGPASSEEVPPSPFASSSSGGQSPTAGEDAKTDASSQTTAITSKQSEQSSPSTDKPYAGRKWSETYTSTGLRVWSRDEWFAGGGSEEGYNS